jgi:hypothetical protein
VKDPADRNRVSESTLNRAREALDIISRPGADMLPARKRQKAERDKKYPALEFVFHDGTGHRVGAWQE